MVLAREDSLLSMPTPPVPAEDQASVPPRVPVWLHSGWSSPPSPGTLVLFFLHLTAGHILLMQSMEAEGGGGRGEGKPAVNSSHIDCTVIYIP